MRVKNAVVVITGAGSGIGKATALAFAREGASLMLAARRKVALDDAVAQCEEAGAPATSMGLDVTDAEAVEHLAAATIERYGRIDVWVNNAGVTMFSPFLDTPPEDLRRIIDVNVFGYVNGARAALPHMREQGSGVLINVASVAGVVAQPYTSAYSMSKAAVRSLSMSLRAELQLERLRDVKVCTVLPAAVDTPLFDHAANYTGRQAKPMSPVNTAERVARTIVGLARRPRREAVSGAGARRMMFMSDKMPGYTERLVARKVDRQHLSKRHEVADTDGNLHEPSADFGDTAVSGGWGGGRRTAQRGIAMAAIFSIGGAILVKRRLWERLPAGKGKR